MAVDRQRLLQNVWGDAARVPPGPVPQLWWIWDPETRTLPSDTAQASRLLTRLGWRASDRDSVRERHGTRLAFRIMVPTTSAAPPVRPPAAGAVPVARGRGRARRSGADRLRPAGRGRAF